LPARTNVGALLAAPVTGEKGEGTLTRQGLEEYVSDCVIFLDHRANEQRTTRRLRVVKYRGSTHGANEYPFLIDHEGISIIPVTSLGLGLAHRYLVAGGAQRG
jgi:circadian clock protein KaiC